MQTWPDLHTEVSRLDVGDVRLRAAREAFELWCAGAERRVLAAVRAAAVGRAAALAAETGVLVQVCAVLGSGTSGAACVVSLELGQSRVDVYSVRASAESPHLHLGVQRGATTTRFPVYAALPGALVVRRPDGTLELLGPPVNDAPEPASSGLDPTPSRHPGRRLTTVDELVLRAFTLLIGAHHSTRAVYRA